MADIAAVLKQLQEERSRIDQAIAALAQLNGDLGARTAGNTGAAVRFRRKHVAALLRQRARWAKVKAGKSGAAKSSSKSSRRIMSLATRRKIAAAQKARWAKLKKAA